MYVHRFSRTLKIVGLLAIGDLAYALGNYRSTGLLEARRLDLPYTYVARCIVKNLHPY